MAVKKRVEPEKQMAVKSTFPVLLTVTIGNRQIGGSIVEFEGSEPLQKGKIKNLLLGKGKALHKKTLLVETNILDSNNATNKMVLTHLFHYEDGEEILKVVVEDEVEQHKDILSCFATYTFHKP